MSKPVITDLHMHVLAWLCDRPTGCIEDAAVALHLELAIAERLFRELVAVSATSKRPTSKAAARRATLQNQGSIIQ